MMSKYALSLGVAILICARCSAQEAQDVVADLYAYADADRIQVRWTTPVPTVCRVQYGPTDAAGQEVGEDPSCLRGSTNAGRNPGTGYANNHRATIFGMIAWPAYVRIAGKTEDGKEFVGRTMRVDAPTPSKVAPRQGELILKIDRGGWKISEPPITVGVPMPKGVLGGAEDVALVSDGRQIPFQASAVSRYHDDGTVKWLRLTFLAPDGTEQVALAHGHKPPPVETPLQMERGDNQITIITGAATLRVNSDGRGELRSKDTALSLPEGVLVDREGKRFVSRAESIEVEEAGPVMIVLRVNGHHVAQDGAKLFAFEERIHAYAGKPFIRLDYTFGNDHVKQNMTAIRSLDLVFANLAGEQIAVGRGDESCTLAKDQRVFQREDCEWVMEPGDRKGKRIQGAIRAGEKRILVRKFWEQWPKSVESRGDELVVGLCPALPAGFYANRKDEHKLYYPIRDGFHTFRQGLAKTHTLYLDVSGVPEADTLLDDEPAASAPPTWIEDTKALRGLAVRTRDKFNGYDESLDKMIAGYETVRDGAREYGMMNYGDWFGERRYNWGNLEYDLHHSLFTQFARTGDARFYRTAGDIARHQGDIDTRHWADDPRRVGQQWTHCMGHTAGYYLKTWNDMKVYAEEGWSDNRGHIWMRGLLEHYLLGGDRRSWESGLLIADWNSGPQTTNFDFGLAREPGWMLVIAMAAYNATEDPFYLNAARLMVRKVREKSKQTGDHGFYVHKLAHGHCNCEQPHEGEAGFMLATLMSGLHMYYEATGDTQAAEDNVKIVRYIIDKMWVPAESAFRYTSCPKTSVGPGHSWIQSEGFGWAANYSKDPEIIRVTLESVATAWQGLPSSGKGAGSTLCFAPQGLHEIAQLPGPSFDEWRETAMRRLCSPARRWLPTAIPNPDFEENIDGWPSRGIGISHCTEVRHSGRASLRIEGKMDAQNEYVNTAYDTAASPAEIRWLKPGEKYRLTAWVRVDRLEPGTPGPSLRIAFRDQHGSRASTATNAYDTTKLGTWQALTVDVDVPEWNVRNYIALNTNSTGPVGGLLYLDDVSLVPIALSKSDAYETHRLDADSATLGEGMKAADGAPGFGRGVVGVGAVTYSFTAEQDGEFFVWAKVGEGAGPIATIEMDGRGVGDITGTKDADWLCVGTVALSAGAHQCILKTKSPTCWIGRILLTTDPSGQISCREK